MSGLPKMTPMDLIQLPTPFDDPDFLFEVKFDGFRALAYVDDGHCELVSRKGHTYKRFNELAEGIATDLNTTNAILDGEIVCLDDQGRSQFYDLMFHRGEPYFYTFDLLYVDGVDLRDLSLIERKAKLRKLIPSKPSCVLYLDHINGKGVELFEQCCKLDLEGVVAKPTLSSYRELGGTLTKLTPPPRARARSGQSLRVLFRSAHCARAGV